MNKEIEVTIEAPPKVEVDFEVREKPVVDIDVTGIQVLTYYDFIFEELQE